MGRTMIKNNNKSTKIRLSSQTLRALTLDEQALRAVVGGVLTDLCHRSAACYSITANC